MSKKIMDKIKDGISVQEMEDFARKYTTEVLWSAAVGVGAISAMYNFFVGPKMTLLFIALGTILGVFFPAPVERMLKQFYSFSHKQDKMAQVILGCVTIVVGLFIPFVLFGVLGLLAGTSYHYYMRHAQIVRDNQPKHTHRSHGDGHD